MYIVHHKQKVSYALYITCSDKKVVLLYVKDLLNSQVLPSLTKSSFQDSVWVHVSNQKCNLIVGVCYRSTASTSENNEHTFVSLKGVWAEVFLHQDLTMKEREAQRVLVQNFTNLHLGLTHVLCLSATPILRPRHPSPPSPPLPCILVIPAHPRPINILSVSNLTKYASFLNVYQFFYHWPNLGLNWT